MSVACVGNADRAGFTVTRLIQTLTGDGLMSVKVGRPILTFDDGPGPSTLSLLHVLEDRAVFFMLGANLERLPDVAIQVLEHGHVLGNHCWSHARPDALSDDELTREIETTDALIRAAYESAGVPAPAVISLRLPYGVQGNDPRLVTLDRLGRSHVGWTLLMDDWMRPQPLPQVLAAAMLSHLDAQAGVGEDAVFCLHDSSRHGEARPASVTAVGLLLNQLRRRDDARDS